MTNETKVKHTPTPWRVDTDHWADIQAVNGDVDEATEIAGARWDGMPDGLGREPEISVAKANLEFIVKAVNNHDALVAMVQKLRLRCHDQQTFDEAENLLAEILK